MIRLSELVSALTPSAYAELALVLFLAVFAAVAIRHGGKRRAAEHARARSSRSSTTQRCADERTDASGNADEVAMPEQAAEDAPVLEHDYDGIREYDNPLPGWWRAMFWAIDRVRRRLLRLVPRRRLGLDAGRSAYRARARRLPEHSAPSARRADAANVVRGPARANAQRRDGSSSTAPTVFSTRCASCHSADGRGLIGPNLTDLYQLHGSTRMDLFTTVKNGVPGTAMPAWGEQLRPADVARGRRRS